METRRRKLPVPQVQLPLTSRSLKGLTPQQRRDVIALVARLLLEATGREEPCDESI